MSSYQIEACGSEVLLRLSGDITIEHARALHHELRAALCSGQNLTIHAADLTRLDAATMQVLLAAAPLAATASLSASSPAWEEAFRRYALENPFTSAAF